MDNIKQRGRPKGLPRTGGRKPGTTNKVTKDLREVISGFLQKNATKMQEEYEKLDPKDKLTFFEKMIKYSLPAMTAVDLTTKGESVNRFDKMSDEELQREYERLKQNFT
ncbi:hypothetical protein H9X96_03185 [Pedobacter sp. N36a]|uniref:hypothetical protein n=1 Tax=Pedobacter sp. N36a TaxID=2767996 RepID=UPI0016570349|nr:hypothetical protein [Pedobacter sp. N36a]MBC8984774.1 hypothetical protein [Pedobacter sp. N36a]